MNMSVRQRTAIRRSTSHPAEGRRMRLVRHLVPALVAGLFWAVPLSAQQTTGGVTGKVVHASTQQPLANVEGAIAGTPYRELTRADGSFTLNGVPAGAQRLRATRIGYGSQIQEIAVTPGGTTTAQISLAPAAAILEPVVVTGYGTQRREAITGSVSTVSAAAANVGVVTNVDQMIQARAAGGQFRTYVTGQVGVWRADSASSCAAKPAFCTDTTTFKDSLAGKLAGLGPSSLGAMGNASTDWYRAVTRTAVTHNHDLSFSGGSEDTRYRASLNYMNQQGVSLANGLERIQGRLTATHKALDDRMRLGVNVTTSRVNNQYILFENRAGFEGGVFQNAANLDPTHPVMANDTTYYEPGGNTLRNPVALANQITDVGRTTRTLANGTAEIDLVPGLTGQVTVGLDYSAGGRDIYFPIANPLGRTLGNGLARVYSQDNQTKTVQTLLTYRRQLGESHSLDVVGGYEYSKFTKNLAMGQGIGFVTDALKYNALDAAGTLRDSTDASESRLVSFLSRANYGYRDRFFVTGVLRYDGSSKFAEGHKWALFPGLSASWHLTQGGVVRGPFSDLRVRVGWGRQGNPGIQPYNSLATLVGGTGAAYPWSDVPQSGVIPQNVGNPNLKWEQTTQYNGAVDFGLMNNRLAGSIEYYVKNTSDLLLEVPVPQPAASATRIENVGKLRNRGLEVTLDALLASRPGLTWRSGVVFGLERSAVLNLGPHKFLRSGIVSGQGQSDQWAQRILAPDSITGKTYPLGTFYGPVFLGVDPTTGFQAFACDPNHTANCVNGRTTTRGGPDARDYQVIGNANPDFTIGLHNQVNWGKFDISFLLRASLGQDVFNNTALVWSTKSNALQDKNFLAPALTDGTDLHEPAIFSSRWVERASFLRLQNLTMEYALDLPVLTRSARSARLYVSADNVFVITG